MKQSLLLIIFFFALLVSCKEERAAKPETGIWRGVLTLHPGKELPFNFELTAEGKIKIFNADEVIDVEEVAINGDSISFRLPVFDAVIKGTFTRNSIDAFYNKNPKNENIPFHATFGDTNRFPKSSREAKVVTGVWEAQFDYDKPEAYVAKAVFTQDGQKLKGTFLTTTGDYRYLEGVMDGDSLRLSTFDGAHAFLFTAKMTDSTLNGLFHSGKEVTEKWTAHLNSDYDLPDPYLLTALKPGYDKLAFSFPGLDGNPVSLEDEMFEGKVVILQIMGSWCPNCLDETKFLTDYYQKNNAKGLEIVALAFENVPTEARSSANLKRLQKTIGVGYKILLAGSGIKNKTQAAERLPMLNHILSYPTTIFIDKKGKVRRIHTGFTGPATGEEYVKFKKEFDEFTQGLLGE